MGRAHRSNGIKSAFFIFDKSPDFFLSIEYSVYGGFVQDLFWLCGLAER
jgi:hypothetical protein